jgi:hypothetical protein
LPGVAESAAPSAVLQGADPTFGISNVCCKYCNDFNQQEINPQNKPPLSRFFCNDFIVFSFRSYNAAGLYLRDELRWLVSRYQVLSRSSPSLLFIIILEINQLLIYGVTRENPLPAGAAGPVAGIHGPHAGHVAERVPEN